MSVSVEVCVLFNNTHRVTWERHHRQRLSETSVIVPIYYTKATKGVCHQRLACRSLCIDCIVLVRCNSNLKLAQNNNLMTVQNSGIRGTLFFFTCTKETILILLDNTDARKDGTYVSYLDHTSCILSSMLYCIGFANHF